jgi:hypothetical protein
MAYIGMSTARTLPRGYDKSYMAGVLTRRAQGGGSAGPRLKVPAYEGGDTSLSIGQTAA